LNNPSATASAITPDGWFKTGDIAISDTEGFLTIIDRRKELVKYKVRFEVVHSFMKFIYIHRDSKASGVAWRRVRVTDVGRGTVQWHLRSSKPCYFNILTWRIQLSWAS
jgi:hypothetical protein